MESWKNTGEILIDGKILFLLLWKGKTHGFEKDPLIDISCCFISCFIKDPHFFSFFFTQSEKNTSSSLIPEGPKAKCRVVSGNLPISHHHYQSCFCQSPTFICRSPHSCQFIGVLFEFLLVNLDSFVGTKIYKHDIFTGKHIYSDFPISRHISSFLLGNNQVFSWKLGSTSQFPLLRRSFRARSSAWPKTLSEATMRGALIFSSGHFGVRWMVVPQDVGTPGWMDGGQNAQTLGGHFGMQGIQKFPGLGVPRNVAGWFEATR